MIPKFSHFLFFDTQIFDIEGIKLKNVIKTFGRIVHQFDDNNITGILSRNFPLFNTMTKEIFANFFNNLLNKNSQGDSLLKARLQSIANITENGVEQQTLESISGNGTKQIDLRSSLALSSYLLFGRPWLSLNTI